MLLAPMPGQTVLDMCSAPGGKSLMLAYLLFAQKDQTGSSADVASSQNTDAASASSTDFLSSKIARKQQHDFPVDSSENVPVQAEVRPDAASASSASDQAASTSRQLPEAETAATHIRTDPGDLAEPDVLAEHNNLTEPDRSAEPHSLARPANLPATLSAQHGQNVAALGSLTCNELDAPRRSRLQIVLDAYLPVPLRSKVR